jgi:hypothetical protein
MGLFPRKYGGGGLSIVFMNGRLSPDTSYSQSLFLLTPEDLTVYHTFRLSDILRRNVFFCLGSVLLFFRTAKFPRYTGFFISLVWPKKFCFRKTIRALTST